jgi:hypothetical protein
MRLISTILISGAVVLGAAAAMAQPAGPPQAGPRAGPPRAGPGAGPPRPAAEGGAYGLVSGVSATGFTLLTPANATVTVTLAPNTTYRRGKAASSARAIKVGDRVRVLGPIVFGPASTLTAAHVVLQPVEGAGTEMSLKVATAVAMVLLPVQNGPAFPGGQTPPREGLAGGQSTTLPVQHIGNINPDWGDQGDPRTTLATGAEADRAAEVAMAAPYSAGGIVNRVVKEQDGTYLVHTGGHWPHHVFVSADLKLIGADN